jgi:lysophospholipase L1-like esterase
MRRVLAGIAAALAGLSLAACSGTSPAVQPTGTTSGAPEPVAFTAVFVGDSYTEGVGLSDPLTQRWSSLVAEAMGWSQVNAGCSGSGYTRQGLLCGTTFVERLPSLADIDADVVIIWGGVNDAGAPPEDAAAAAADTIAAYASAYPDADLVVLSAMYFTAPEPASLAAINAALPAAVSKVSGQWVDLGPALAQNPPWLGEDGLHPNAEGHRAIADAVIKQLGASD